MHVCPGSCSAVHEDSVLACLGKNGSLSHHFRVARGHHLSLYRADLVQGFKEGPVDKSGWVQPFPAPRTPAQPRPLDLHPRCAPACGSQAALRSFSGFV